MWQNTFGNHLLVLWIGDNFGKLVVYVEIVLDVLGPGDITVLVQVLLFKAIKTLFLGQISERLKDPYLELFGGHKAVFVGVHTVASDQQLQTSFRLFRT